MLVMRIVVVLEVIGFMISLLPRAEREPKSEKKIVECSIVWWLPEQTLKIRALQNTSRYFSG